MLKIIYDFNKRNLTHAEMIRELKRVGIKWPYNPNHKTFTTKAKFIKTPVTLRVANDVVKIEIKNQKPVSASKIVKLIDVLGVPNFQIHKICSDGTETIIGQFKCELEESAADVVKTVNEKFIEELEKTKKTQIRERRKRCYYKTREKTRRNNARAKTNRR